jgi:hypothetical protein
MSLLDASRLKDPLDAIRAALLDGSKTPVQCDVCLSQVCDGVRAAIVFPADYKRKTLAIATLRKEISDAQNKLDKLAHVDWLGYQRGIASARETTRRYFRRKAIDDERLRQGRHDFGSYWSERLKTGSFVLRHLELLESREYSDCKCEGETAGRDAGLRLLSDIFDQNSREFTEANAADRASRSPTRARETEVDQ